MDIIYSAGEIANRIAQLGREITEFYRGEELTVVALMNGALPFAADLIRAIGSTGEPEFRSTLKSPPSGRHILLADEVLDSGVTLQCVAEYFRRRGAASVRTVVMVEKELPRPNGLAHADWTGFTAPDRYLVGYGLDADEHYRNLPYIAALN